MNSEEPLISELCQIYSNFSCSEAAPVSTGLIPYHIRPDAVLEMHHVLDELLIFYLFPQLCEASVDVPVVFSQSVLHHTEKVVISVEVPTLVHLHNSAQE
jgi:hypothetical protein